MNKIEIIKQAIERRTGAKVMAEELPNDIYFRWDIHENDEWYQQSYFIAKAFLNYLPLSETEVNGVTEKNGWVSVERQLPKDEGLVLVCNINDDWVCAGAYETQYKQRKRKWYKQFSSDEIIPTHWKPLPPKADQ